MPTLTLEPAAAPDEYAARRAVAVSNVRHFRRLAWLALRDGMPGGESRAVNARRAALIVLATAKREARRYRAFRDLLMTAACAEQVDDRQASLAETSARERS